MTMTIMNKSTYFNIYLRPEASSSGRPWRVSTGDARWRDQQRAASLLRIAAGAVTLIISVYISINKLRSAI